MEASANAPSAALTSRAKVEISQHEATAQTLMSLSSCLNNKVSLGIDYMIMENIAYYTF